MNGYCLAFARTYTRRWGRQARANGYPIPGLAYIQSDEYITRPVYQPPCSHTQRGPPSTHDVEIWGGMTLPGTLKLVPASAWCAHFVYSLPTLIPYPLPIHLLPILLCCERIQQNKHFNREFTFVTLLRFMYLASLSPRQRHSFTVAGAALDTLSPAVKRLSHPFISLRPSVRFGQRESLRSSPRLM